MHRLKLRVNFQRIRIFRQQAIKLRMRQIQLHGIGLRLLLRFHFSQFLSGRHMHAGQVCHNIRLDDRQHVDEQVKGFFFVFLLRVLLRIAAQMNALAQVIHGSQMLFPVAVKRIQHEMAFQHGG